MNVNALTGIDGTLLTTAADQADRTANNNFTNYMNQSLSYGDYLEQIFQKASMTYNVSKDLLKAMAKAESNFRADATSHCGAMGIMQLMPGTAASLGVTDAYNPEQNIMGGAKYISRLLEKYNGNFYNFWMIFPFGHRNGLMRHIGRPRSPVRPGGRPYMAVQPWHYR